MCIQREISMNDKSIVILTEAGNTQGFGHLSRCCALYDESVALGIDTRLIVNATERLPEMPRNVVVANWLDLSVLMQFMEFSNRVIVDSYLADFDIYKTIADNCKAALYIDDYMRIVYPKGIVVNPSLYGDKIPYIPGSGSIYLGGHEYVIVRPEFQNVKKLDCNDACNSILITMGGSDILNLTPLVLGGLVKELPNAHKHVVIGPGFSCIDEITLMADGNTELHNSPAAAKMRDLMLSVDIAITAAGQTIYEMMSCGIPMIPIKVIDNQGWNIKGLQRQGFRCLDAAETDFNDISWKDLIDNSLQYQPLSFNGQKEIIKALIGA